MKKVKKNKENKFPVLIFLLSILMLMLGFYYEYVASPTRIFKKALTNITSNLKEVVEMFDFDTGLKKDYTKTSSIKITSNSSNYSSKLDLSKYNKNLTTINYPVLTKNLSETNTTVKVIMDSKNKKRLVTVTSSLNGANLLNTKSLIENSTEYYYDTSLKNTYINLGNNTYFESLGKNTTESDNFKYLYDHTLSSLASALSTKVKVKKENSHNKITLTIDNKITTEIINKVLTSLKNDNKSSQILTSYNQDFKKIKSKENYNILPKDAIIELNIYTEKYTYKITNYEIIYKSGEKTVTITYQYHNKASGEGKIIVNSEEYTYKYKNTPKSKEIILYSNNKKVGEISIEKTNTGILFDSNTIINNNELNINYIYNILNLKKNTSYNEEQQLIIRSSGKNQELLNFDIVIKTKVTSKNRISENTSSSIIKNALTQEEQNYLVNKNILIFNKLNS